MNEPSQSPRSPAGTGEPVSIPTGVIAAPAAARPLGVLVVDDDEGVRRMLGAGMWNHGFAVWLAAGGPEAVDLYRRHRGRIDLVLLDVRMPDWDGPRTLAALRDVAPGVRFCFMTGDPGSYTEQHLLDLGAAAVLRKPFCLSEVAWHVTGTTTAPDTAPEGRWRDDGGRG